MTLALVTGGAGFIGSHLVCNLIENSWQVRVLDNFSTGKRENISGLRGKIEVIEGDLRDPASVRESVRGVDVIFHQAAFVSVAQSMEQPGECFDVNVRGTEHLLQAAKDAGVKRIVIASSAAVYGDSETIPLNEDIPTRCLSPYAASKNINEIYASLYTQAFNLEVTCLRYFNVYGPRQRPDSQYAAVIPIFINRCLEDKPITIYGDGGQTRDLVYVDDIVRANLIAAQHPAAPGRAFNICTGRETRIIDLVEELQNIFPKAPRPLFANPRPGDIYRSVGSPERIYKELGFRTDTSLAKGLQATVEWIKRTSV